MGADSWLEAKRDPIELASSWPFAFGLELEIPSRFHFHFLGEKDWEKKSALWSMKWTRKGVTIKRAQRQRTRKRRKKIEREFTWQSSDESKSPSLIKSNNKVKLEQSRNIISVSN